MLGSYRFDIVVRQRLQTSAAQASAGTLLTVRRTHDAEDFSAYARIADMLLGPLYSLLCPSTNLRMSYSRRAGRRSRLDAHDQCREALYSLRRASPLVLAQIAVDASDVDFVLHRCRQIGPSWASSDPVSQVATNRLAHLEPWLCSVSTSWLR